MADLQAWSLCRIVNITQNEKDPVQVMSFVDDWHKLYEVQTTQRQQHSSDDTKSVVPSAIQQQYEWHQYTTLWILEHNSNKQNLCQPMRMTSYPHLLWNNHIKINHINAHHILLGLGSYVMWTDVIPCFTGKWLAIQPRIKIERETVRETRPESHAPHTLVKN